MKCVIIYDKYNLDTASAISNHFTSDVMSAGELFDESNYDLIIIVYYGNKGVVSDEIKYCLENLFDSNVCLISTDKWPLDSNYQVSKFIRFNGNSLVYAHNGLLKLDVDKVCMEISNKFVRYDGFTFSEKLVGFFSRIGDKFGRKG